MMMFISIIASYNPVIACRVVVTYHDRITTKMISYAGGVVEDPDEYCNAVIDYGYNSNQQHPHSCPPVVICMFIFLATKFIISFNIIDS